MDITAVGGLDKTCGLTEWFDIGGDCLCGERVRFGQDQSAHVQGAWWCKSAVPASNAVVVSVLSGINGAYKTLGFNR